MIVTAPARSAPQNATRPVLEYQSGFGNVHGTEAVRGALPVGQNAPQRPPKGLYAEVISGTSFTAPRAENLSSWLYRLRPSAMHAPFRRSDERAVRSGPFREVETPPNRLRWNPLPIPNTPADVLDEMITLAGSGEPAAQSGVAVHIYRANRSMSERYFVDSDGELMFVPQLGEILIFTELGKICIAPGEIGVVPRGVKFKLERSEEHTSELQSQSNLVCRLLIEKKKK